MEPNFVARQDKLKKISAERGIDAVLVTGRNDVYYYTGYLGFGDDIPFLVLPVSGEPLLMASPLSNEAAEAYKNVVFIRSLKDVKKQMSQYRSVGYDGSNLDVITFKRLRKGKWVEFAREIKSPRQVKDEWEIGNMVGAIRLTNQVLKSLPELTGKTEEEVASLIDIEMRRRKASNAFETIVASGRQGHLIHHRPNGKRIGKKDMVIIDLGCRFRGYCSDISRTIYHGSGRREKKVMETVRGIQKEIIDNIVAGVEMKFLRDFQEKLFKKAGYEVKHAFGHGVGLSVHEGLGNRLQENNVVTVEPGIYIKGFGGCRIEDMVLVKKNGTMLLSDFIRNQPT